jgi:type I restriction enzyme R subunit
MEAAKIQGFTWKKQQYDFDDPKRSVEMLFDENTYLILALRYKELFSGETGDGEEEIPYDIDGYLVAIDTGRIDTDYMNSRFEKYLKILIQDDVDEKQLQATLDDLHISFASLTQEEQKYANIFIHDVQSGNVEIEDGKTFREYITEYQYRAKNEQVLQLVDALGIYAPKLENLMNTSVAESSINEYGRFDDLKKTVNRDKAKTYFETVEGTSIPAFQLSMKIDKLLKDFILSGGFDIHEDSENK